MRKLLLATAATFVLATPAAAQDAGPYFGIEGGILMAKDQDGDVLVDYTTTQDPATPAGPAGPGDTVFNNAFGIDYNRGIDIDVIGGYDFGAFRIEGELGYKRAKFDEMEISSGFITGLNTALNLPAGAEDPDTPGDPALVAGDFDLDGKISIRSAMVNALADFGDDDGLGFYAGGGFGRAWAKQLGESDHAWAWQLIAGVRYAITPTIDLGLKYRYFRTGKLDFADDSAFAVNGNPNVVTFDPGTGPIDVVQTTNAVVATDFEQKFRSHSLLASLVFNFGEVAEPAPLPPPPPPPVVEAPATQTCPDGSVILATSACPVPPPPPPPVERGERGL
jgi:opacity protein-like surface antigen